MMSLGRWSGSENLRATWIRIFLFLLSFCKLVSLNPEARGSISLSSFRGNCFAWVLECEGSILPFSTCRLLVTRVSFIFLGDEFIFLFLVLMNKIRTLGESKILSFCLSCWSSEWESLNSKIHLSYPQGF